MPWKATSFFIWILTPKNLINVAAPDWWRKKKMRLLQCVMKPRPARETHEKLVIFVVQNKQSVYSMLNKQNC